MTAWSGSEEEEAPPHALTGVSPAGPPYLTGTLQNSKIPRISPSSSPRGRGVSPCDSVCARAQDTAGILLFFYAPAKKKLNSTFCRHLQHRMTALGDGTGQASDFRLTHTCEKTHTLAHKLSAIRGQSGKEWAAAALQGWTDGGIRGGKRTGTF